MTQKEKKKKKEDSSIPLLHKSLAHDFLEHMEPDGTIPYSKVKWVLRFKYRVPKKRWLDILKEFRELGLLEKETNLHYKIKNIEKIENVF